MTDAHQQVLDYIRAHSSTKDVQIRPKQIKEAEELRHLKYWTIDDAITQLKKQGYIKSNGLGRGLCLLR